jgi:glycosyltransferase involved in cell wall biosynthesis
MPLVSVLIPVYNGGRFLLASVQSALAQTYRDLEVLVLDDGSTDGAVDDLLAAVSDPRLRVLRHPNRGLSATLNRGIQEAEGELLARLDADDLAHASRIERQVEAMLADPSLVLVGGQVVRLVADADRQSTSAFPLSHEAIVRGLLRREHVLCHPAVLLRREAAVRIGGYWAHGPAEDWDLFLRLAEVGRLANLPDVVLDYRFHETGINATAMCTVRRNMRLATVNATRRGAGLRELDPADLDRVRYLPHRLTALAEARSLRAYRMALRARTEGRRASAARHLAEAAVFWPQQAIRRLATPRTAQPAA